MSLSYIISTFIEFKANLLCFHDINLYVRALPIKLIDFWIIIKLNNFEKRVVNNSNLKIFTLNEI